MVGWAAVEGKGEVSLDGDMDTLAAGNRTSCGGGWRSGTGLQALGQVFQLVQHFGERWELVASERFVSDFFTGSRVIDTVNVFVRIAVEVMVLEQQVTAGNSANVAEPIAV